jgi:hypothetical protein
MLQDFSQIATVIFKPLCAKYNLQMDCSDWDSVIAFSDAFALVICHDNYGGNIYYMLVNSDKLVGLDLITFLASTRKFIFAPHAQPAVSYRENITQGLENSALTLDVVGEDILRGETQWMNNPHAKFQLFNNESLRVKLCELRQRYQA